MKGWTIDWGDGSTTNASGAANGDPGSFTHIYTSTGFYTVAASTIDGSFSKTQNVEAEYNYGGAARLAVTMPDDSAVSVPTSGTSYSIKAKYTDPAGHAVNKWIISWGDGTIEQYSDSDSTTTGTSSAPQSTATRTFTHTYGDSDIYISYDITISAGTSENWYT